MSGKNEIIKEYARCLVDIAYYGEKYCEAFDQTGVGVGPLKVFPKQKELLKHYEENRFSIVLKPRQAGVSTVTALFAVHKMLFATYDSPQKILIVANKLSTAKEFFKKIRGYLMSRPDWLNIDIGATNNQAELELVDCNGRFIASVKSTATSEDAMRGYTPTLLIMDEAAFIERGDELWTSAAAALSTGGRTIFISTPGGQDALYYETYRGAINNENDFKIFEMRWWQDPRFNKDLSFYKGDETCFAKKLSDGHWDIEDSLRLIKEGWFPTSSWYRMMCRSYNGNKIKISQELDCVSLDTVVTVKNKKTGKIEEITINELYKKF